MKWVLAAVLALVLLLPPAANAAVPTTTGTLHVQQAASASLVRMGGGGWKLVLDRPDRYVIAFADRPVRTGRAYRVRSFVRGWAGWRAGRTAASPGTSGA